MQNEFVPYELAIQLKELGFDEPCFAWYVDEESILGIDEVRFDTIKTYHFNNTHSVSAPLYQQAFRWIYRKLNDEIGCMPIVDDKQIILSYLNNLIKDLKKNKWK